MLHTLHKLMHLVLCQCEEGAVIASFVWREVKPLSEANELEVMEPVFDPCFPK